MYSQEDYQNLERNAPGGGRFDAAIRLGNQIDPIYNQRSSSMAHINQIPRSNLDNMKSLWRCDYDDGT